MSLSQMQFLQGKDADSTTVRSGAILKTPVKQVVHGEAKSEMKKKNTELFQIPFWSSCRQKQNAARFEKFKKK